MKIVAIIVRVLLGLAFTVFGLNIFLNFIPQPPMTMPPAAESFMAAFIPTGYMKVVGLFELIGGLLVLGGYYVPVGLTLLGPVLVNILIYHTLIMRTGWQPGAVFALLELFLIYYYRRSFAGIFQAKPVTSGGDALDFRD